MLFFNVQRAAASQSWTTPELEQIEPLLLTLVEAILRVSESQIHVQIDDYILLSVRSAFFIRLYCSHIW
uniref:Uncharacterized protein n=1 Tax=Rhizophora mucronata TaxID=61149 RepID=A0A2P2JKJ9_RHIMU